MTSGKGDRDMKEEGGTGGGRGRESKVPSSRTRLEASCKKENFFSELQYERGGEGKAMGGGTHLLLLRLCEFRP